MTHKCQGRMSHGFRSFQCGKTAKIERDGDWYCGVHDPVKREERRAASNAKYRAKFEEQWRRGKLAEQREAFRNACVQACREIANLPKAVGSQAHALACHALTKEPQGQ